MRRILGLLSTLFIGGLVSLAVALAIGTWPLLARGLQLPGILTAVPLLFVLTYCLLSAFDLPDRSIDPIWTDSCWSEGLVWCSFGVLILVELLTTDPLLDRSVQLVRDGFYLPDLSTPTLKVLILGCFVIGYGIHQLYQWQMRGHRSTAARKTGWFTLSAQRYLNLVLVLGFFYLLYALYAVHMGFQSFVIEATGILLQGDIELFRDYLLSFGIWAPLVSAFLMIFVLVVAPPLPAFVVTFTNGLLFGAVWGTLLSWSSAMIGAAMSFYIARGLGRPVVEGLFPQQALEWTDQFFRRYGVHSVLVARLIPVVSFALVSYGAGLTAMRFLGFFVATGIGQLPATVIYSWLGEHATGSIMYVFWAFVVVIAMAVIGAAFRRWMNRNGVEPEKA